MNLRLSERERDILRLVVQSFVSTAGPVGSRYLSSHYRLGLSSASIRNTMNDLEAHGYLGHPYTSAGRVPTDRGYRTFVDQLMESFELSASVSRHLRGRLEAVRKDRQEMLRVSSHLLGELTNLLGVVLGPRLATGILERIEIVPLSSTRVMFVLSVRGGLVRTMILHRDTSVDIEPGDLRLVVSLLNERLAGLTLEEIRHTCRPRVDDLRQENSGIVQWIVDESPVLFSEVAEGRKVNYKGTSNIVAQPEFQDPDELKKLIELLEDEEAMFCLMEDDSQTDDVQIGQASISIGTENANERVEKEKAALYSIVTARYRVGDTVGTIGVLGPKRMNYAHVVSLVEGMAEMISSMAE